MQGNTDKKLLIKYKKIKKFWFTISDLSFWSFILFQILKSFIHVCWNLKGNWEFITLFLLC